MKKIVVTDAARSADSIPTDHAADADIVRSCIRLAVEGPAFPDWEFHTLFGTQRSELERVARDLPATGASVEVSPP